MYKKLAIIAALSSLTPSAFAQSLQGQVGRLNTGTITPTDNIMFQDSDGSLKRDDALGAFSDGISSKKNSLFSILQEQINTPIDSYSHNSPQTQEQSYYRSIFEENYPYCSHLLNKFWMPKYIKATDPSARTLNIYK